MLRTGTHLRQARDLLRIDGDPRPRQRATRRPRPRPGRHRYGRAAQLCLQEADASQAPAWYALAKTARWQRDYASAADLASRGFETGPSRR